MQTVVVKRAVQTVDCLSLNVQHTVLERAVQAVVLLNSAEYKKIA